MGYKFANYKDNQIVFYGDIMGFSSCMIEIEKNNNQKIDEGVYNILDNLYKAKINDYDKRKELGVNFIWLSDSFTFAGDKSTWVNFKSLLLDFISTLWTMDFIFNGALQFGKLHNDKNIMGARFVEAVRLQESCHTPEIIISKEAYCNLKFDKKEIYINDESKVCFDYVYCILCDLIEREAEFSCFGCLYDLCKKEISNSNESVKKKYIKMVELVIDAIDKIDNPIEKIIKMKNDFGSLREKIS